ncbi:hypothetical protein JEP8_086 [Escherichia phage JEP8]|uniref:Zinc-ribbon domain-containing protein n=1 Tax=Escherichia phage JEP8 TaxID=2772057 RepID=A0A7S6HT79_9CAUD|nr:hypothetical protein JEP8_086 [Escherichia phage JEP8]
MLVRKAHEIEWVKKNYNSISPLEYYERLKPIFEKENIVFNGFVGEWKGNVTKLGLVCCEGHEFTPRISDFQKGKRCSRCANNYALSKEEYYKKLKPIFIEENIKFNGFVGEWKGVHTKLNLTCCEDHEFTPTITAFQVGSRCPKCKALKLRELKLLSKEEYLERLKPIFEKENIVFNGFIGEWNGSTTKMNLLCSEGHKFTPTVNGFQSGNRCSTCGIINWRNSRKISKEEYFKRLKPIFVEENITCNGIVGEWKGSRTRLNLVCNEKHNYTPSIAVFQQGRRCPKCKALKLRERKLIPKEEYFEKLAPIFIKENITCNGIVGEWKGNVTKLDLVCCEGHNFTPIISSFQNGTRCPKCANNYALSKEEYLERLKPIFEKENIIFNGFIGEWNGVSTKLNLVCSEGHEFTPTITNFQKGTRCPKCAQYGYNTLKKGVLYIQKLIKEKIFVGVKFGITNRTTKERIGGQSRLSKFNHEIFYELTLQDGQKILDLENKIKEAMKGKTSYISKEDMPDGYTETVAPSELSTIMYIVKTFEKELTA